MFCYKMLHKTLIIITITRHSLLYMLHLDCLNLGDDEQGRSIPPWKIIIDASHPRNIAASIFKLSDYYQVVVGNIIILVVISS